MGAGQSSSQAHPPTRGLHVLRVTPSSPASLSNIEPFFDFVVGFEGDSLASAENNIDAFELEKIVESHENRILNLLVWNSKDQRTRGMVGSLSLLTTIALYFESSRFHNTIAPMVTTILAEWFSKFTSHFATFSLGFKHAPMPTGYCCRQCMACS